MTLHCYRGACVCAREMKCTYSSVCACVCVYVCVEEYTAMQGPCSGELVCTHWKHFR